MIVKLKQEYRGIKKGKEINVSKPMAKYLGSIGLIDNNDKPKDPVKKKTENKTANLKNSQPKDSPIQKSTAGKSKPA